MEIRRIKNDELYHHGVKGQRWGIRRYQNPDGSLTAEGIKRYAEKTPKEFLDARKEYIDAHRMLRDARVDLEKHDPEGDKFGFEHERFKKMLKASNCPYDADTMDLGIGQIYLLNRGINPNKYAQKLKASEKKYHETISKYRDVPVTDKKNIKGERLTVNSLAKLEDKDSFLWDSRGLESTYKEDIKIFEDIAKAARKDPIKNR